MTTTPPVHRSGTILVSIIILGGVAITILGALASLFVVQVRASDTKLASEQAFHVAESGINLYAWRLAHDPNYTDDITQSITDTTGRVIGTVTVTSTPPAAGSTIVTIDAAGISADKPNIERYIRARYGRQSYAQFAFLTNTNVWFGENESVNGRLHSNGGIRIDGIVDSLVTTIKETYICGAEHGCSNQSKPGIWGSGQDPNLWNFPVANSVDFNVITVDLQTMYNAAVASNMLLPVSTGFGNHIVFNSDGTFSVYRVKKLRSSVNGYTGTNWVSESNDISTEAAISGWQNIPIPTSGIIFSQDQTWVSGQVNGRVTVAAARLPEGSGTPLDIIIHDNITYYPNRTSGSVLGLVAQQDILVPLYSPNNLTVDAALLAKGGHVFRYYYQSSSYPTQAIKASIESYGTIITNALWTWTWVNGSNQVTSGYQSTNTIYDPDLLYAPPPYFPTQDNFEFISWEELDTPPS